MRSAKILTSATFILWSLVAPAAAHSCDDLLRDLGKSIDALVDGEMYVQLPNPVNDVNGIARSSKTSWQLLTPVTRAGLTKSVPGLIVVKDITGRERVGVVVVKTGRFAVVPQGATQEVALVRRDSSRCAKGVDDSSISAEVYDGFHDFGRQNFDRASLSKLRNFHVNFGSDCKQRTDDDPGGFYRHVSNRASFSFTPDVVDTGGYTGFEATIAKVGFGRVASAQRTAKVLGYANRQAEIKPYRTAAGLACIPTTVPYIDQGSFFRTNDLAGPFVNDAREKRY